MERKMVTKEAKPKINFIQIENILFNPLVPDAHYSERHDKFSLQIQRLEVNFKLNWGFLFFAPQELTG